MADPEGNGHAKENSGQGGTFEAEPEPEKSRSKLRLFAVLTALLVCTPVPDCSQINQSRH